MNNAFPDLTPTRIAELLRTVNETTGRFFNQSEIAALYGVSPQNVSQQLHRYGLREKSPRQQVRDMFPYGVVGTYYSQSTLYKLLMDHGEYITVGRKRLSAERLRRLRRFYQRLKDTDTVVTFDPAIEPGRELTEGRKDTVGGFAYVPREAADGDLLVRVNEFATLTSNKAEAVWSFPPEWPDVEG